MSILQIYLMNDDKLSSSGPGQVQVRSRSGPGHDILNYIPNEVLDDIKDDSQEDI